MEQQRTFEGMMKDWTDTYKYCLVFEDQIKAGAVGEEEVAEYLQEKARLIVCLGNLFAVKSVEDKETYDIEYVNELYANVKENLEKEEVKLSEFDDAYISNMLKEMEKDFFSATEETCEKCGKQPCECEEEE